jgi:hypothetical protein
VTQSDFFFPPTELTEGAGGIVRYRVPDVTPEQLQMIAFFFRHDSLPRSVRDSLVSRDMLREVVERHGPSSMLTYLDDPIYYSTSQRFPGRIDKKVSRKSGTYLLFPSMSPQRKAFSMRQSPVDVEEYQRVKLARPEAFVYEKVDYVFSQLACYFNGLSLIEGLDPAYVIDKDKYPVDLLHSANGFKLPEIEEWLFAMGQSRINSRVISIDEIYSKEFMPVPYDEIGLSQMGVLDVNAIKPDLSGYYYDGTMHLAELNTSKDLRRTRGSSMKGLKQGMYTFRPVRAIEE